MSPNEVQFKKLNTDINKTYNAYTKAAEQCADHPASAKMPEIPMPAWDPPHRKGGGATRAPVTIKRNLSYLSPHLLEATNPKLKTLAVTKPVATGVR